MVPTRDGNGKRQYFPIGLAKRQQDGTFLFTPEELLHDKYLITVADNKEYAAITRWRGSWAGKVCGYVRGVGDGNERSQATTSARGTLGVIDLHFRVPFDDEFDGLEAQPEDYKKDVPF